MINLKPTAIPPANRTGKSRRNVRLREPNQPKVTIQKKNLITKSHDHNRSSGKEIIGCLLQGDM